MTPGDTGTRCRFPLARRPSRGENEGLFDKLSPLRIALARISRGSHGRRCRSRDGILPPNTKI